MSGPQNGDGGGCAACVVTRPLGPEEVERWGPAPPTGDQLRLLESFNALYSKRGLLPDEENPPLWQCCPNATACWGGIPQPQRPAAPRGGITLPWIGAGYAKSRILILPINLRAAGGLFDEQWIVAAVLSSLRAGRRRIHNSPFAYRTGATALAVLDHLRGAPVQVRPPPEEVADAVDQSARLQLVKCSPFDGKVSAPTPTMWERCPSFLLTHELQLLAPRVIITFGAAPRSELGRILDGEWRADGPLHRGHVTIGGNRVPVVASAHPNARSNGWLRCQESLTESLAGEPLL